MEPDRALVDAIVARRSARAFDALYDRHTAVMYGLALRLTGGDQAEAGEITQNAWVRAIERLDRFEWRAQLSTWLCAFVVNCARESARHAARLDAASIDEIPIPSEDRRLTGAIDRVDLERAVAALPPGYRHVLVLHDVEGYRHEEIAALLGITAGTSKSQLSRARVAMRRALGTGVLNER
jgi:RNA polymerase sigma-70 factor (ECF subfamily)